jgi:uncharacterized membrane protein YhaH (DUF805 family)
MDFGDSIKTCFTKYADFNGRASRSEYWWFVLFLALAHAALALFGHWPAKLFSLATLLPSIAVASRRLHDTDKTGWLQLIVLIPVLGWIAIIYLLAQESKEPNRYGAAA